MACSLVVLSVFQAPYGTSMLDYVGVLEWFIRFGAMQALQELAWWQVRERTSDELPRSF